MGMLNLAAPFVLFEKSRLWASTGFHLLPSFHHPTQHNYTTHTVILTSLPPVHYTDTCPTRNVVCPSGVWIENRSHSTPSIHLARNPKHVIVQWVGIGTHTLFRCGFHYLCIIFTVLYFEQNCTNQTRDYNKRWQQRYPVCHLPPIG